MGTAWLEAGTAAGAAGRPPVGAPSASRDGAHADGRDGCPRRRSVNTQSTGLAAACGPLAQRSAARWALGSRGVPGQRRGWQDVEPSQQALVTNWAALDIDAGDAQHQVPGRLWRYGRRGRLGQERPALPERVRAAAIGEQAEVADADEAVGDDVEQEATEEFVDLELHDLAAVAVGVVAPPKADAALGCGEQPVVGERDAVGVVAEVGEHLLGPGEGRLAVDDPRLLAELVAPRGKRRGLGQRRQPAGAVQLAPVEGLLQAGQIPASEDLGQGTDREEEVGPSGNPACPIGRQRSRRRLRARDESASVPPG